MFCILRVGKKHKSMYTIKGFQIHMNREKEVPNANPEVKNEILIGDADVYKNMSAYLQGVKLRNNSVLAREILTTASPEFFEGLLTYQLHKWKEINKEWLLDNFGTNCIYSVLHKDEKTWHIHSLIVPKFQNNKGEYILSNTRYFNGRKQMSAWQDNYYEAIQKHFPKVQRGIKYSKARHIDIKTYYSFVNQSFNENDVKSLCAHAKNAELLEIKMKAVLKTLDAYKRHNESTVKDNTLISKELKKTKEEKEVYKEVIGLLSKHYNINADKVKNYISHAENSLNNSNERGR